MKAITIGEYQDWAQTKLPARDDVVLRMGMVLGLAGEAGESVELIKKAELHGHALDRVKLREELGDALFYIAALARLYGITLDDIVAANIYKLNARYPHGYTREASPARADKEPST